jgi:hypothetical protein
MSRQLMLPVIALMLSGCIAQINERSVARWLAVDIICSIDESVIDEKDKLLPNGWLTKPYSPTHWQEYWGYRVHSLAPATFDSERPLGYSGPAGKTYALYALQQRRELGLPDLLPQEQDVALVSGLYAELDHSPRSSCEILDHPSPVCTLGPAQRPIAMEFRRECGRPDKAFPPRPIPFAR